MAGGRTSGACRSFSVSGAAPCASIVRYRPPFRSSQAALMAAPSDTLKPCKHCNDTAATDLYTLKIGRLWQTLKEQHSSFWFLSLYITFEYIRPQSIIKSIDILPWSQLWLILALATWVTDKHKTIVLSGPLALIIIFNILVFASIPGAYFPGWAKQDLSHSYNWLIIFFLMTQIVNNRARLIISLLIIMAASFKLTLFGAKTWTLRGFSFTSWGMKGPPGFFENSGEYAIQCLIFTVLVYQFAQAMRPYIGKWMYRFLLFAAVTGVMSVIASSSRGAQVALLGAMLYLAFAGRIRFRAILAAALVFGSVYLLMPDEQIARFQSAGEDETSLQRIAYWQRGADMMLAHPWLGVGYNNFRPYFTRHYPQDLQPFQKQLGAQLPHNILVQVGTDLGIPALLVYLMLCWTGLRMTVQLRKQSREGEHCVDAHLAKGLAAGLVGFFIAGQFVSVVYYPFLWIQMALIVCLYNIALEKPQRARVRRAQPSARLA